MKSAFAMVPQDALGLFAESEVMHLACVDQNDRPLLRTFHAVVVEDAIAFHGGQAGEKLAYLDREVVATAHQTVAQLPSHFFDPERACPATTYYRSAIARGRVEAVVDPKEKARVLEALMARFQPEGGYRPIDAEDSLYGKAVRSLLVARIVPTEITGKAKLGQHHSTAKISRALEGLWRRGSAGDLEALEAIRRAHPRRPTPAFLRGPGVRFDVAPGEDALAAAVELVQDHYWNEGVEEDKVRSAHRGSQAWIVARDETDGPIVATARAVTDGSKAAIVYDVAVREDRRGRGVGEALLRALLDHPSVRRTRRVLLRTRDAQSFYAKLGFDTHRSPNSLLSRTRC